MLCFLFREELGAISLYHLVPTAEPLTRQAFEAIWCSVAPMQWCTLLSRRMYEITRMAKIHMVIRLVVIRARHIEAPDALSPKFVKGDGAAMII